MGIYQYGLFAGLFSIFVDYMLHQPSLNIFDRALVAINVIAIAYCFVRILILFVRKYGRGGKQ